MSFEQSIDKLTAALEAATGVLVTLTARNPAAAQAPATTETPKSNGNGATAAESPKRGPGRPKAAVQEIVDDDLSGGQDDEGGLGDEPTGATPQEAKELIFAYRDAAIAAKGKDDGLSMTRTLMKKHVVSVDAIDDSNAQAIFDTFTKATTALKKGK